MLRKAKRISSLLIAGLLVFSVGCGGSKNNEATEKPSEKPTETTATEKPADTTSTETEKPNEEASAEATEEAVVNTGEPTIIRWGHNWTREMDTSFRDPITGEPALGAEELNARIYAEEQILAKYNAKIEFVQYPSDVSEIVLQTVLAGDPIADIVRITDGNQGKLLEQNVLQPLDEYASLFAGDDDAWMYWGKAYDHNYFLNNVLRFGNKAPLCYNITMLEKVDALKEDGKTVLPVDLWKDGKWTWSVFEDYLQKVSDYWRAEWDGRIAYSADYRTASLQAMHANGASVYGNNGLEMNNDKAKEAVAFIDRLIAKDLIRSVDIKPGTSEIDGLMDVWRFQWGHAIFGNLQQWLAGDMVGQFNGRGETMGVVPFPRPDGMAADDPNYQQLNDATDCYGIPKGVSKEMTELTVKVFKEYSSAFYKKMANSEKAMDYLESDESAKTAAIKMFLDITNEEYGQDLLDAWKYLGAGKNALVNEYVKNVGLWEIWNKDILGNSFYGINGAPKYNVQVEATMGRVNDIMNGFTQILNGTAIVDNIEPKFTDVEGTKLIYALGTDPATIPWTDFVTATDNIDGALDIKNTVVDYSGIDFNAVGKYDAKLIYTIKDSTDNEGESLKTVTIYDGANTTPPTLEIKAEFRKVKIDENSSNINWKDDFVEKAEDKDGLNLKDYIVADLSEIDTTTVGDYNVVISVKDFAGNESTQAIIVSVVKE